MATELGLQMEIVEHHELAVAAELDIEPRPVKTRRGRLLESEERVLRPQLGAAPMGDVQRLHCATKLPYPDMHAVVYDHEIERLGSAHAHTDGYSGLRHFPGRRGLCPTGGSFFGGCDGSRAQEHDR